MEKKIIKITKDNMKEAHSIIDEFVAKVHLDLDEILQDNENEIEVYLSPFRRTPMGVDEKSNIIFDYEGVAIKIKIDGDVLYKITRKYDR